MADKLQITVDGTQAKIKLDRVPVAVRNRIRSVMPDLVRQIASVVDSNLAAGLKSRNTLTTEQEVIDNATRGVTGRVAVTSPTAGGLLPLYLEEGTEPHVIEGNPVLSFFWPKLGKQVFFASVNHPGFKGIHYMQNAFDQMQGTIIETLQEAARDAARGVR